MEKKKPEADIEFKVEIPDLSTAFDTPREVPKAALKDEPTEEPEPDHLDRIFP